MFAPRPVFSSFPQYDPDLFIDWEELLHKQLREQQLYRQHVQQQRAKARHLYELQFKPHCNASCSETCMKSSLPIVKAHDDCTAGCGGNCSGRVLISHPSMKIRLDWSGAEPSAKEYVVTAHLPDGVTPNDVSVSIDELDRLLTLSCQQQIHQEEKDTNGKVISSHSSSSFTQRTLRVPEDVDLRAITASKLQGEANTPATGSSLQLLIHMPKVSSAPQQKPTSMKQIHIQ